MTMGHTGDAACCEQSLICCGMIEFHTFRWLSVIVFLKSVNSSSAWPVYIYTAIPVPADTLAPNVPGHQQS